MCILYPDIVNPFDLFVAGIIGSCQQSVLGPGNENSFSHPAMSLCAVNILKSISF